MSEETIHPRFLRPRIVEALADSPVVLLHGPRQCGKTTLARLVDELPSWHRNRMKRLVKTPKLHVGDTGLACALLGLNGNSLWGDRSLFGRLLETFVYQELRRLASWHEEAVAFSHFRDKDQVEVDVVLESEGLAAVKRFTKRLWHDSAVFIIEDQNSRKIRRMQQAKR